MTLKTLGKTTWDKIKIGEVFANKTCWFIAVKLSEKSGLLLDCTHRRPGGDYVGEWNGKIFTLPHGSDDWDEFKFTGRFNYVMIHTFYKLPLATQRLWRCDK